MRKVYKDRATFRGGVSLESIIGVALVGLVGLGGFGSLGGAFRDSIAGDGQGTARSAPAASRMATSRQAGMLPGGEGLEAAAKAARASAPSGGAASAGATLDRVLSLRAQMIPSGSVPLSIEASSARAEALIRRGTAGKGVELAGVTDRPSLLQAADASFKAKSGALRARLATGESLVWDTVFTNPGPVTARGAFEAAFSPARPRQLVIEAGETVAASLREVASSPDAPIFTLNSRRRSSANDEFHAPYATRKALADFIALHVAAAETDVLLGAKITHFERAEAGAPARYAITLDNGQTHYAHNVVVGGSEKIVTTTRGIGTGEPIRIEGAADAARTPIAPLSLRERPVPGDVAAGIPENASWFTGGLPKPRLRYPDEPKATGKTGQRPTPSDVVGPLRSLERQPDGTVLVNGKLVVDRVIDTRINGTKP